MKLTSKQFAKKLGYSARMLRYRVFEGEVKPAPEKKEGRWEFAANARIVPKPYLKPGPKIKEK